MIAQLTRALAAFALGCAAVAGAQPAAPREAFGQIEPGQWQVRGEDGAVRELCLLDPASLVQQHHAGASCSRMVIADSSTTAVVHYSCPGTGWGRTTFQIRSPRKMRITTQGIDANLPFDESIEARRTGECPAVETASGR